MKKKLQSVRVINGSDQLINAIVIFLALFGLVMAVSATMNGDSSTRSLIISTIQQLIYFVISYALMVIVSKLFSFDLARVTIMPFSWGMVILLLSTLLFEEVNGAKAWIRLPFFGKAMTIQPSEFAKVSMIILIAMYLGDRPAKMTFKQMVYPVITILGIHAFIITIPQSDFGTAVVLILIAVICCFVPSHPNLRNAQRLFFVLGIIGAIIVLWLISDNGIHFLENLKIGGFEPGGYKLARVSDYANPFNNIHGSGYQLVGSLIAFNRGGLFGKGLGQSIQKYGYLPEARTDFILAIIAEELGFVGVMVVFILYGLLIWRLIYFAMKVSDERSKIILVGTASYFFIHFFFNVGGITSFIPLTGVPLLLVSAGGSSTMAAMLAIGISQRVIAEHKLKMYKRKRALQQ